METFITTAENKVNLKTEGNPITSISQQQTTVTEQISPETTYSEIHHTMSSEGSDFMSQSINTVPELTTSSIHLNKTENDKKFSFAPTTEQEATTVTKIPVDVTTFLPAMEITTTEKMHDFSTVPNWILTSAIPDTTQPQSSTFTESSDKIIQEYTENVKTNSTIRHVTAYDSSTAETTTFASVEEKTFNITETTLMLTTPLVTDEIVTEFIERSIVSPKFLTIVIIDTDLQDFHEWQVPPPTHPKHY